MKPIKIGSLFTVKKVGRKVLPHLQHRAEEYWGYINDTNIDKVIKGTGYADENNHLEFHGKVLDGVDLTDCGKHVSLISCIAINCKLPERSLVDVSILVNTSTAGNSLFIGTHLESGRAGRCDAGPDSFFKDCSIYNGMVVNKGSVVLSTLAAGTKNVHIESGATIYGGIHYQNTYGKDTDILYVNGTEVRGAYQMFLDRNNANISFSKSLSLSEVYSYADEIAATSLLDSCRVIYPENIVSDDYLVNKSINDVAAAGFIKGEYRGRIQPHNQLTRTLIHAHQTHKVKHFKPEIEGVKQVERANALAENYAEITDLSAQIYRRDNSVQMLGSGQESLKAFENDFLSQLYLLYTDKDYGINEVVDAILKSGDKNLESGINRHTVHKIVVASAEHIDKLIDESENVIAPAPS